ncbi:MAG: type IV secretory system conjugative DNA transfer family protein [Caulobacterales bacterium]|nr:type IV secretory system conjugative DNA transfer family protein [Caulobacterales bacterium]
MSRFANASWPLKAAYIALLGAAALVAMAVTTGLIALAGLHRLSPILEFERIPAWFWYFRGDPEVRRWLGIGALTACSVTLTVAIGLARGLKPPLHGAARFANEADLRRGGLRSPSGIVLGRKDGRLLSLGGPDHVLLYAPTRTGKGVGVVIPNLLTWPDSVVVLDIKRENWIASAGFRQAHGQEVLLFDPLDAEGRTARFNPLGHINRENPIAVLDELQKLSVMLFPAPEGSDPFWAEASRTGFIGVGAYVAETPELSFSLGCVYTELTNGDPRTRLPQVMADRVKAGRPLSFGCVSALSDFCSASENTFASIKQTVTARLNLWLNPHVAAATDVSDFDLRDLRARRISLYLGVTPDNLARVAPLYSLLLQQLIDLNTRELPSADQHGVPVLVVLDEFARLGHATVLAHAFSYVAGYGLRLLPVIQSPSQLRAEYGPDLTDEIIANCGVEIAFAPKELKVAQDLSARLGTWTYSSSSRSRPEGLGQGHRTVSDSDQRRPLMLPQELMQMPSDRLIVLKANLPPVLGRKIVYWREAAFTRRVLPPPTTAPHVGVGSPRNRPPRPPLNVKVDKASHSAPTLNLATPPLDALGLAPPPHGASEAEVEAWVDRFLDASIRQEAEKDHG